MNRIKYIGPINDSSGYSNAVRNNIVAIARSGLDLVVHGLVFEHSSTDYGTPGAIARSYQNKNTESDINIIHCTPENWHKYIEKDRYNVGYTTWETSKLPDEWVPLINQVNEVWVPSRWNKEIFTSSGVTIPIYVVPHVVDKNLMQSAVLNLPTDGFKFYSIFQWTERKNPEALLKAYCEEFTSSEAVYLILKTYAFSYSEEERKNLANKISSIKEKCVNKDFPKILHISHLLSANEIAGIHNECDCYVAPHRGEGFGIPLNEAMAFGNTVITTDYSGSNEFCNEDTAYLLKPTMVPVTNMPWGKYTSDQLWADVSVEDLRKTMRHVFSSKNKEKATMGRILVEELNSIESIGNTIKTNIERIRCQR